MYCPNCYASVEPNALNCGQCNADFGFQSSWRPLLKKPDANRLPRPIFSKTPKPVHAFQAIALFAVAGPFLGMFALALSFNGQGSLLGLFHPFALIGAFAIGGAPAVLAGTLYCAFSLTFAFLFPRVVVNLWWGALLGAVAGAAGAVGYFGHVLHEGPGFTANLTELARIGVVAGLMSGLLTGWLIPVGKIRNANSAQSQ